MDAGSRLCYPTIIEAGTEPSMADTARVFWSGNRQVLRLPAGYRLEGDSVRIRPVAGGLLLEPMPTDWSWLADVIGNLDDDFVDAALDQPRSEAPLPGAGF